MIKGITRTVAKPIGQLKSLVLMENHNYNDEQIGVHLSPIACSNTSSPTDRPHPVKPVPPPRILLTFLRPRCNIQSGSSIFLQYCRTTRMIYRAVFERDAGSVLLPNKTSKRSRFASSGVKARLLRAPSCKLSSPSSTNRS